MAFGIPDFSGSASNPYGINPATGNPFGMSDEEIAKVNGTPGTPKVSAYDQAHPGDYDPNASSIHQATQEYNSLTPPSIADQTITAQETGPSAYNALNPESSQGATAQQTSMNALGQIISGNGMTAQDQDTLRQINEQNNIQSQGARQAVQQQAAARGLGSSGISLAGQLSNQQGAATRAYDQGSSVLAGNQANKQAAINALGSLGGQYEGQAFGEGATKAGANDALSQFNANQRQNTNLYNSGLYQQGFGNNLAKASGAAGTLATAAGNDIAKSAQNQAQTNAIIGGVLGAGGTLAGAALTGKPSDERAKKDIKPGNKALDDLLGHVSAHEYKYKDPDDGPDSYVGPMAQELEKSDVGKGMVDEDETGKKHVDGGRAALAALAGLAEHKKRLDALEKK